MNHPRWLRWTILSAFCLFMIPVVVVGSKVITPRFQHWIDGASWGFVLAALAVTAFLGALLYRTLTSIFKDDKSEEEDDDEVDKPADKTGDKPSEKKAEEKKADKKKDDKKKDDKKSDSLPVLFLKALGVIIAFALGLWPLLVIGLLWTKIPSKTLKGLVLIVALTIMVMQGYTLLRIKHPEIGEYVGSKLTQVSQETRRTNTQPETTWWMKSIDTPTKLKPVATEHPAHQLTIVEWDRNSVIHFRYRWTTNTGQEKQVDYRWDIAHEPDYGTWTMWVGGKPTQHARWRMEWNEGQGSWIGSEEDTDGLWHSFTIYPRK